MTRSRSIVTFRNFLFIKNYKFAELPTTWWNVCFRKTRPSINLRDHDNWTMANLVLITQWGKTEIRWWLGWNFFSSKMYATLSRVVFDDAEFDENDIFDQNFLRKADFGQWGPFWSNQFFIISPFLTCITNLSWFLVKNIVLIELSVTGNPPRQSFVNFWSRKKFFNLFTT